MDKHRVSKEKRVEFLVQKIRYCGGGEPFSFATTELILEVIVLPHKILGKYTDIFVAVNEEVRFLKCVYCVLIKE